MSALLVVLAAACAEPLPDDERVVTGPEPLVKGERQRERLCGRGDDDLVTDVFCGDSPPEIRGLSDLRAALGLGSEENGIEQGFALTGHSTSLVSRLVSAINPRIIFVRSESEVRELIAMAFARGEQFSELVVRSRVDNELRFYLAVFSLRCQDSEDGCKPADLYTDAIESGWTEFDVYGEEDVQNSPLDCRVCHQPNGPGTPKLLRMQEFDPPWNHWFYRLSEGGRALIADYYAARGQQPFAGVPGDAIRMSQPGLLSSTIYFAGSPEQPNAFVSAEIEPEVRESAAANGGAQPHDNSVPGESDTWQAIYERAKRGEAISVPYHDVKVTDPDKLAAATLAYAEHREGRLPPEQLPDLADVFPEDAGLLARMGFVTEPDLDGEGVLMQACAQCHNRRLDQTLSRARFDVDLEGLSRAAKDLAIARVSLALDDPAVMPPARFRRLGEQGRKRLIDLLER
jgi:hypothetical protein